MRFSPLAGIRYAETTTAAVAPVQIFVSVPLRGLDMRKPLIMASTLAPKYSFSPLAGIRYAETSL